MTANPQDRIHPQARAVLAAIGASDAPAPMTVEATREFYRAMVTLAGPPEPVHSVRDAAVPGPAGPIPVRVYQPSATPAPLLVYVHGGSFMLGDLDTHDPPLRALANRSGCTIVSVGYRLAPEHPFPAGLDDVTAALSWIGTHAAEVGGDGRLAVMGDSAGGGLAAVAARRARDENLSLSLQVLLYPITDATMASRSWAENDGVVLSRTDTDQAFAAYLPAGMSRTDERVSPLFASDLAGLAPALVITAEIDPLRDEGEAYAARLRKAGVPVTLHRYDGMIHGFFQMAGEVDAGGEVIDEVATTLREAFLRTENLSFAARRAGSPGRADQAGRPGILLHAEVGS